jgi:hypothetical protein
MAIGYELEALLAIYGPDSVKLSIQSRPSSFHPDYPKPTKPSPRGTTRDSVMWDAAMLDEEIGFSPGERIRYEVSLPIWEADEVLEGVEKAAMPDQSPSMRVMVSLPPTYPNTSPPQLQLLGRYLGNFSIDTDLCELGRSPSGTYADAQSVPLHVHSSVLPVFRSLQETYASSKVSYMFNTLPRNGTLPDSPPDSRARNFVEPTKLLRHLSPTAPTISPKPHPSTPLIFSHSSHSLI